MSTPLTFTEIYQISLEYHTISVGPSMSVLGTGLHTATPTYFAQCFKFKPN